MISHDSFPAEPWTVRETALELDLLGMSESIFALSNGHLGLRGNLDEGEPRELSGTYLNGFYESHPIAYGESGYGFAEDDQTLVNVTDGKLIRLLVEDEPLDVHRGTLESHERELDLRSGLLTRRVTWTSEAGRSVRLTTRRLVSFRVRSVAAISYEVEALGEPLRVTLQSNLLANQVEAPDRGGDPRRAASLGAVLEGRLAIDHGMRVILAHTTRRSDLSLGAGMDHLIDGVPDPHVLTQSEPDLGRVTISAALEPGTPLRVVKLLAYHWSSQQSIEWLRDQVDASLSAALALGFDGLAESQREALDGLWDNADIELDGDPEIQQALRFALFHVFQASARTEARAIPAKGLTGPGYDGHAFWDTETYVLSVLTYTLPRLAREALMWRHSTLGLARERASQLGLKGAALPWRTIHGEECSGYWPAGTAAFHVGADVADAVARYVHATNDHEFERAAGVELLVETARLWASLGHRGVDDRFRIDGVTGPDEYSALADNNVYTNLMAQSNLRAAAAASEAHPQTRRRLDVAPAEIDAWRAAADAMLLPYDERLQVHPQDEHFTGHERWDFAATNPSEYPLLLHHTYFDLYRKQVVKQADLVLALFRRGDAFSAEEKRRDFAYYEALTVRDSSLSASIQSIVAAEVGHMDLAWDYLAEAALLDLRDLEHNIVDGVHIASLAGAAMAVLAGLGGMRDHGGSVVFAPRLPREVDRLAFRVTVHGRRLGVEVGPRTATYTLRDGDAIRLEHWGEPFDLTGTETLPIPAAPVLERPRQPRGREPVRRSRGG